MDQKNLNVPKTISDLAQASDETLLNFVNYSKGHTGKDFSEYFKVEYSYSKLTNELKERGYRNGWYHPYGRKQSMCMEMDSQYSRGLVPNRILARGTVELYLLGIIFRYISSVREVGERDTRKEKREAK